MHAGKSYKALIDSGVAVSLIIYSTYQKVDHNFKNSYTVYIDTPQYSGWMTYDSIGNNYTPTSDSRL